MNEQIKLNETLSIEIKNSIMTLVENNEEVEVLCDDISIAVFYDEDIETLHAYFITELAKLDSKLDAIQQVIEVLKAHAIEYNYYDAADFDEDFE